MRSSMKDVQVLVSGLTEPGKWLTTISHRNYPLIQDMLQHCAKFLSILKQARFNPQLQVRSGLYLLCNAGVWPKLVVWTQITHSYGGRALRFPGKVLKVAEVVSAMLICRVGRLTAIN